MESSQRNKYIPLIIAVSVIAGILTGIFYSKRFSNERKEYSANFTTSNKLNGLLRIINDQYVDTVHMTQLI